jgi:hypothetical protein
MSGYVVKYRVAGFNGERTTPVYPTFDEAERQADDIRGYEGVQYASVHVAPDPPSTRIGS